MCRVCELTTDTCQQPPGSTTQPGLPSPSTPRFTSNPLHLQAFSYCATTRAHQSFPAVCGSLTSWQAWGSMCGWGSPRPPLYASVREHHVQKRRALPSPLLLHQVTQLSLVWLDGSVLSFTVTPHLYHSSLNAPCCGVNYSLSRRSSTSGGIQTRLSLTHPTPNMKGSRKMMMIHVSKHQTHRGNSFWIFFSV